MNHWCFIEKKIQVVFKRDGLLKGSPFFIEGRIDMRDVIMGMLAVCGVIWWCIAVLVLVSVNLSAIIWMVYIGLIGACVGYVIVTVMEKMGKLE
jgi:hypothetical protein